MAPVPSPATPLPPLTTYVLARATPEQYTVSLDRQHPEWGAGLTVSEFHERELLLSSTDFGKRLRCWVLVPVHDLTTLDFPSYCETYRRPILLSTSSSPIRTASYSIASVFTHPLYRKRGFARRMMSLLHAQLGLPYTRTLDTLTHEETVDASWSGGKDGAVSFLYSDVGAFYGTCLPEQGDGRGWEIRSPVQRNWVVDSYVPSSDSSKANFTPISKSALESLALRDSALLLSSLSLHSETTPSFIVEPTFENYTWAITRSQFYLAPLSRSGSSTFSAPRCFGFEFCSPTDADEEWRLITFVPDYVKSCLKITRLRGGKSGKAEAELIDLAVQVARECGLEKVWAWNCGVKREGEERKDSLSAVKVYGAGKERVEWRVNENYAWC